MLATILMNNKFYLQFNDAMIIRVCCVWKCAKEFVGNKRFGWAVPRMLSVATGPNVLQRLIIFKVSLKIGVIKGLIQVENLAERGPLATVGGAPAVA